MKKMSSHDSNHIPTYGSNSLVTTAIYASVNIILYVHCALKIIG